ncbi:hypothetical protein J6590_043144 [Homalodisca vitripennis]|nr:hypothetical protein J6590_043144 [Homalodisca vitripennis]
MIKTLKHPLGEVLKKSKESDTDISSTSLSKTTHKQATRKLKNLNPDKGAGPDNIPPSVLKFCSSILAPHISIFWNCFFSSGIFPPA